MDGILIIDKPPGMTSHDVVYRVRRILKEKRIGHTGTLDPFATGVLVLLVGRATRLAQFLNSDVKEYEATVRFGFKTDTGDLTGKSLESGVRSPESEQRTRFFNEEEIESALSGLRGEILQVPPMYSAKKVKGKKLYELARQGEVIERKSVPVTIYEFIKIEKDGKFFTDNDDGTIEMNVRVRCSAGTYIRTLAESLGENLGIGAHLSGLRRTKAGDFSIENSLTLEKLEEYADKGNACAVLLPIKKALSKLDFLHLTPADAKKVSNGMTLKISEADGKSWRNDEAVSLFDNEGNLIAIAFYNEEKRCLQPRVVLVT